jgi:hypothetical protein
MLDTTGDLNNRSLLIQDILQIFSDRRQVDGKKRDIINIYKYDSNKVYHAVSNRFPLSKVSIPVFRDGFISKIYKRLCIKRDTDI